MKRGNDMENETVGIFAVTPLDFCMMTCLRALLIGLGITFLWGAMGLLKGMAVGFEN